MYACIIYMGVLMCDVVASQVDRHVAGCCECLEKLVSTFKPLFLGCLFGGDIKCLKMLAVGFS